MVEGSNSHKHVLAQELSGRFRSKDDLYRYLTQQGRLFIYNLTFVLVGVFLPTINGTSLDFLRKILNFNLKLNLQSLKYTEYTI